MPTGRKNTLRSFEAQHGGASGTVCHATYSGSTLQPFVVGEEAIVARGRDLGQSATVLAVQGCRVRIRVLKSGLEYTAYKYDLRHPPQAIEVGEKGRKE